MLGHANCPSCCFCDGAVVYPQSIEAIKGKQRAGSVPQRISDCPKPVYHSRIYCQREFLHNSVYDHVAMVSGLFDILPRVNYIHMGWNQPTIILASKCRKFIAILACIA